MIIISMLEGPNNKDYWFAIIITSVGAILIFAAIVRGAVLFLAFLKGYYLISSIRDLSINVIGVAFNFIMPLVGGSLLLASGSMLFGLDKKLHAARIRSEDRLKSRHQKNVLVNSMLSQGERNIFEIIKARRGQVLQSDLVGLSGYSKVKVHRIIKSLENKNSVRRTRHGITNKIFLVER